MSPSSMWRSWLAGAARIFDAVMSSHSPLKRARRIWLRNRFLRMMKVQARMLVPAWKRFLAAQALSSVSWTRSSARSRLPDSERPNARRCGMTWASWSLNSSSGSGTGSGRTSGASSSSSSSIAGCRFKLPPSGYAALNSLMLAREREPPPSSFRDRQLSPDQQQQEKNHDHQAEAHRQDDPHHMIGLARAGASRVDMAFAVLHGPRSEIVSGGQRPLAGAVPSPSQAG